MKSKESWYETCLPWRGNHPLLPNNKTRLDYLARKLEKQDLLKCYDEVIQEQIKGTVESANEEVESQRHKFYLPHKLVIQEYAETTQESFVRFGSISVSSGGSDPATAQKTRTTTSGGCERN